GMVHHVKESPEVFAAVVRDRMPQLLPARRQTIGGDGCPAGDRRRGHGPLRQKPGAADHGRRTPGPTTLAVDHNGVCTMRQRELWAPYQQEIDELTRQFSSEVPAELKMDVLGDLVFRQKWLPARFICNLFGKEWDDYWNERREFIEEQAASRGVKV